MLISGVYHMKYWTQMCWIQIVLKMSETALRTMRSDNAKLMETNLSLLMAIRETDTEATEMRLNLLTQCKLLEKRGIPVPQHFLELLAESQQDNQRPTHAN